MATGYNSRQSVRSNYSDDRPSSRSSVRRNRSPSENDDPNSQTRNVVDKFKDFIQKKIDENAEINEKVVEMGVSTIRRQLFRERCRISTWQKNLPPELEDCPDDILISSIAYGNNPDEVKPIIQEKINQPNSSNISIVKVIGPLKKLKGDLDKNREVNLFRKVRNFDDEDTERANRLFYSEAVHSVPGVLDYTYENAAEAVEGIRNCSREVNDNSSLYTVMKVCKSADEVRDYLENNPEQKSTRKTTSSIQSSPPTTRLSRNRTNSSSDEEPRPTTRRPERR